MKFEIGKPYKWLGKENYHWMRGGVYKCVKYLPSDGVFFKDKDGLSVELLNNEIELFIPADVSENNIKFVMNEIVNELDSLLMLDDRFPSDWNKCNNLIREFYRLTGQIDCKAV